MSAELYIDDDIDTWLEYERLKADLPHDLTEQQYEQACKQIADELGI